MADPVKVFAPKKEVTMANAALVTDSFKVPSYAIFCGVFIPAIANGIISLQISTNGTDFYPLLDPLDGESLVVCAAGADPGWVDISDYIRFVSLDMDLRLKSSVAADEAETFELRFAG